MRVVLSTYGSRGDLEPFVALAARLTARGVEVRVCAPPDEAFAARLDAVGVALMPVWRSARALTTEKPEPASLPQRAAELIADQFEAVTAAAQGCDLLVATGMLPATAGALSVAENLGLPTVSVSFQQLTVPSPHHRPLEYPGRPFPPDVTDYRALWDLDTAATDALFRDALNINRASAGLPAVPHVRDYVVGDRPWVASDPVLDPLLERPDLDVVQTGAWLLPDDRPLSTEVCAFLDDGPPPIYVGFGSMPLHDSADAARDVVQAVRSEGRRVVLLSGWWADLAADDASGSIHAQEDVLVVGEVNHQALFTRVAAVVHHGGAGTTTTAARAGVPQVVVAQAADQPYWARRVAELGIGVAHAGPSPTAASLVAALSAVSNPSLRDRARLVADEVRSDGADVAATRLLSLAETSS